MIHTGFNKFRNSQATFSEKVMAENLTGLHEAQGKAQPLKISQRSSIFSYFDDNCGDYITNDEKYFNKNLHL